MGFSAIINFAVGLALIVYGIYSNGTIGAFLSFESLCITLGGTVAAVGISFPVSELAKIPAHLKLVLFPKKYRPQETIRRLSELALVARRDGILALEGALTERDDPFLKSSVLLIVDSIEHTKALGLLNKQLDYITYRHENSWAIYRKAASFAPAFGMIGTVIGLINMLNNMNLSGGPETLASGMALALITTFYGTVLANLVFLPFASRLQALHNEEMFCKELIVEGVLAIQDGSNPKFIEDYLQSFAAQNIKRKDATPRAERP